MSSPSGDRFQTRSMLAAAATHLEKVHTVCTTSDISPVFPAAVYEQQGISNAAESIIRSIIVRRPQLFCSIQEYPEILMKFSIELDVKGERKSAYTSCFATMPDAAGARPSVFNARSASPASSMQYAVNYR